MQITDDDIQRFQAIWREAFQEEISADEARAHIGRLDALYLLLSRPISGPPSAVPQRSEATQHQ